MFVPAQRARPYSCDAPGEVLQSEHMAAAPNDPAPRGTETILLVQPEPESRTLAAFMLARLGYTVLEAHNAMEALKIHDERGGGVDLLLAELRMPRVSGQELAQVLEARAGTLRVLFMADADYARLARRIVAQKHLPFLTRPFTMRVLAEQVRNALDHPARRPKVMAAGN
jgi:two-component system, cell cycle sensor histidine kinase and response regulator CckA